MKMGKCSSCIHSKDNNSTGKWCKYSPNIAINDPPGDCSQGTYSRYESIYTIEPTIVLGSRYYSPPSEEMVVVSPSELTIEGVE